MANSPAYGRIKNLLSDKKADVKKYLKKDYQSADELVNLASQLSPLQQVTPGFAGGQDKRTPVDARGVQTELAEAIATYNRAFDSMTLAIESAFKREARNIIGDIQALSADGGPVMASSNANGALIQSISTSFSTLYRDTNVAYTNLGATIRVALDKSIRFGGIRAPAAAGVIGSTIPDLRALEQATRDLFAGRDFYDLFNAYEDMRASLLYKNGLLLVQRNVGGGGGGADAVIAGALEQLVSSYAIIASTCLHLCALIELFSNLPTARAKAQTTSLLTRMEVLYDELKKISVETIEFSLTKTPYLSPAAGSDEAATKANYDVQMTAIKAFPVANFGDAAAARATFTSLSTALVSAMSAARGERALTDTAVIDISNMRVRPLNP